MKKQSNNTSQTIKLVAVFVAGLAVATLGWYYSDRLNIAFGKSSDINQIGENMGWRGGKPVTGFAPCNPGEKPKIIRTIDGCEVVTVTQSCSPNKKYVNYERTRSGVRLVESDTPKRGSTAVTKYDLTSQQIKKNINQELIDADKQLNDYKRGKSMDGISYDEYYNNLLSMRNEIKVMSTKIDPKCRRAYQAK